GQGLPGRILDEADGFRDAVATGQRVHGLGGLLQRLSLELTLVEVEVELAGQADFVDPLDADPFHGLKRRLAVEAQEAGSRVEDAVAVPRERDEELLRALEPEPPLDDREAEDVEPAGGSNGGAGRTVGGFVAQKPYLATNARILRDRESTDPPPGSRWPVRLLAS